MILAFEAKMAWWYSRVGEDQNTSMWAGQSQVDSQGLARIRNVVYGQDKVLLDAPILSWSFKFSAKIPIISSHDWCIHCDA